MRSRSLRRVALGVLADLLLAVLQLLHQLLALLVDVLGRLLFVVVLHHRLELLEELLLSVLGALLVGALADLVLGVLHRGERLVPFAFAARTEGKRQSCDHEDVAHPRMVSVRPADRKRELASNIRSSRGSRSSRTRARAPRARRSRRVARRPSPCRRRAAVDRRPARRTPSARCRS